MPRELPIEEWTQNIGYFLDSESARLQVVEDVVVADNDEYNAEENAKGNVDFKGVAELNSILFNLSTKNHNFSLTKCHQYNKD